MLVYYVCWVSSRVIVTCAVESCLHKMCTKYLNVLVPRVCADDRRIKTVSWGRVLFSVPYRVEERTVVQDVVYVACDAVT